VAEWDPDVVIDEVLVRALLAEQFPELDARSVRLVGEGWDNAVWLVDDTWAFRLPRRAIAVPLVARELAVLSRLATLVPAPVPVPEFVGVESGRFSRPFFGHRLLAGGELAAAELTDDDRVRLGKELGRFLHVLHAPGTREAVDPERALPLDPNRRADMPLRVRKTRERLDALADLAVEQREAAERALDRAAGLPPSTSSVLVHGDLHARHVLVERGRLSGVIDWGDVCVGDPSIDLLVVWSTLQPRARETFFDEYGEVGDATRLRAQVLAIFLSATLADYARDRRLPDLERACLDGLERALVD
jgi:aminoglycoside phosphotransferase (APT) family kinase protein